MSNAQLLLRPVEQDDVGRVAQLQSNTFGASAWSAKTLLGELDSPRVSILYLLEYGGELLSMFGCWHVLDDLYLATIAVQPQLQRRGLGELTLLTVLRLAQRLPVELLRLDLRVSNEPALALYRKYGFRREGVRRKLYAHPLEDGVQMSRDIPGAPLAFALSPRVAADWSERLTLRWRGGETEIWSPPPQTAPQAAPPAAPPAAPHAAK